MSYSEKEKLYVGDPVFLGERRQYFRQEYPDKVKGRLSFWGRGPVPKGPLSSVSVTNLDGNLISDNPQDFCFWSKQGVRHNKFVTDRVSSWSPI